MRHHARDSKGRYLYKVSIETEKDTTYEIQRYVIARKKPIKLFDTVLSNELKKRGLLFAYLNPLHSASLSILEQWEHERIDLV